MHLRTAVFGYAALVILLAVISSAVLFWYGSQAGARLDTAEAALVQARADEQSRQNEYRRLESEQQAGRAAYDPVETVQMSYKVQEAKEQYEEAMDAAHRLEPQTQILRERKERIYLWLIPVIVAGLLHIVLAAMFRPQHDELAAAAVARRKGSSSNI